MKYNKSYFNDFVKNDDSIAYYKLQAFFLRFGVLSKDSALSLLRAQVEHYGKTLKANHVDEISGLIDMGFFEGHFYSPYEHILYDQHSRLSTIYIPKNGCTMVKKIFLEAGNVNLKNIYPGDYHPMAEQRYRIRDLSQAIDGDHLKFVVLRSPASRIWSALMDKFVSKPEKSIIERFLRGMNVDFDDSNSLNVSGNLLINDLLDYIIYTADHQIDKHFASQASFLPAPIRNKYCKVKLKNLTNFAAMLSSFCKAKFDVSESPHSLTYSNALNSSLPDFNSLDVFRLRNIYKESRSLPPVGILPENIISRLAFRYSEDEVIYSQCNL